MKDYELVCTEDGSFSIRSKSFDQAMHSHSGAWEEALLKHVIPSGILETVSDRAAVLDLGFGLGYNSIALIELAEHRSDPLFIDITAFEYDGAYLDIMKQIKFQNRRGLLFLKAVEALEHGSSAGENFRINLIKGDARNSILNLSGVLFDAVFHDPYSPSKNPELWTSDYFIKLSAVMKDEAVLTTYSSAAQVRGAMIEAGFRIGPGPSVGPKREGTLASRIPPFKTFSDDDIQKILNDEKSVPYRDPEGSSAREEIIESRRLKMKTLRVNRSYQ